MPSPTVSTAPDYDALCDLARDHVVAVVSDVLSEEDEVAIALAGGSTPRGIYNRLGRADLPWERLRFFWGDERMVPYDHPESNVQLVRETLFSTVSPPPPRVHPMPTSGPAAEMARRYERTLRDHLSEGPYTFDLAILGLGSDGHTASLFPGAALDPEAAEWVRPATAPPSHAVRERLTCTLSVLNRSRRVAFLGSGASKREAVTAVLRNEDSSLPATHVHGQEETRWLLDADAFQPAE